MACQLPVVCLSFFSFLGVQLRNRWFRVKRANHTTGTAPQYVKGGTSHGLDCRSTVSILPTTLAATCEYSVPLKQSPTAIERPPPCLQSSQIQMGMQRIHYLGMPAEDGVGPAVSRIFCTQLLVHTYTCTCWAKDMLFDVQCPTACHRTPRSQHIQCIS